LACGRVHFGGNLEQAKRPQESKIKQRTASSAGACHEPNARFVLGHIPWPARRGLTLRSSGAPTAGHQRPVGGTRYIFTARGLVACRWLPLSSNVRHFNTNAPTSVALLQHLSTRRPRFSRTSMKPLLRHTPVELVAPACLHRGPHVLRRSAWPVWPPARHLPAVALFAHLLHTACVNSRSAALPSTLACHTRRIMVCAPSMHA
jgi:hypothetical protein